MSSTHRRALALLGTAVLAGIVAWRVDLAASAALLAKARWPLFLLAAALGPVQIALSGLRWQRVAASLGPAPPVRAAVEAYAASTLLNQLLPGGVGGDVLRAWDHHRRWGATGERAALSALLERGAGQVALLLVVLPGTLAWPHLLAGPRPPGVLALASVLLAGAAAVALCPVGVPVAGRIGAAVRESLGIGILALSLVITVTYILGFALCAAALGLPPVPAALTAIPLILLAMALPISWGGWGLREAAAAALLPALGWSAEAAVAASALYGLSVLLGAAPGAVVLLRPVAA